MSKILSKGLTFDDVLLVPAYSEVTPDVVDFAVFQSLDLRVGTVCACERVPKADKLLRLLVDLGEAAPRQILSGIAEHFEPESLVGRQVFVVANLAPRTIRGLESHGMILSASSEASLRLLGVDAPVLPGSRIS